MHVLLLIFILRFFTLFPTHTHKQTKTQAHTRTAIARLQRSRSVSGSLYRQLRLFYFGLRKVLNIDDAYGWVFIMHAAHRPQFINANWHWEMIWSWEQVLNLKHGKPAIRTWLWLQLVVREYTIVIRMLVNDLKCYSVIQLLRTLYCCCLLLKKDGSQWNERDMVAHIPLE